VGKTDSQALGQKWFRWEINKSEDPDHNNWLLVVVISDVLMCPQMSDRQHERPGCTLHSSGRAGSSTCILNRHKNTWHLI